VSEIEKPDPRLVESVSASVSVDDVEPDNDEGLDALQMRAADMIASGCTVDETAKATGKSTRTIRRWKKDPTLASVIRARATEAVAMGRAVLSSGMHRASRALVGMADGTVEASAPRVSAAKAVVESTVKLVEVEELRIEMEAIKSQLASQPGGRPFQGNRS
jgi:hypothetical protein